MLAEVDRELALGADQAGERASFLKNTPILPVKEPALQAYTETTETG